MLSVTTEKGNGGISNENKCQRQKQRKNHWREMTVGLMMVQTAASWCFHNAAQLTEKQIWP